MFRKLLRLLPMLVLAACSHPTQYAAAPSQVSPATTQDIKTPPAQNMTGWPVIVAFGDSLTAGYGAPAGQSYPDFLQQDLVRDGYRYRVVNLGVSGNTSKDALARVKDVLAEHPALVIVEIGGNDGLRGVPVPQMRDNLDQILATLSGLHVPIVLGGMTLPPNYGAVYVQQFSDVFPTMAAKYHLSLLPFMLQGVWDHPELIQEDGIHPTAAGNEVVAKNYLPLVERLLRK